MNFLKNLKNILNTREELLQKLNVCTLGDDFVKLSKDYVAIESILETFNKHNSVMSELKDLKEMITKDSNLEHDIRSMIYDEIESLNMLLLNLEKQIKVYFLPKDIVDTKNVIIEVRAGSGGREASLFAASLFNMYSKYSELKKWNFEILSISDTGIGGYKEASALIKGQNVFSKLKFESGTHRVQRVPNTEANGRIHTSTATVAVLPEAEDIDVKIEEKDLRIDTYRSSGAGGQHVNTTDSAVRITHLPTGIVVTLQDEKSQHKNKAKAMKILRARVYKLEREKYDAKRAEIRKDQVGSGDRSERIRTYNFLQGRVSDHRINLTLYKIDNIIKNGQLDDVINALIEADEIKKLTQV